MKIPTIPGLQVFLRVHDDNLAEYDDADYDGDQTVSCSKYVEASQDSTFAVRFAVDTQLSISHPDCISCAVYLDGSFAREKVYDVSRIVKDGSYADNIEGLQFNVGSGSILKKFSFAHLQTHDGLNNTAKVAHVKKLGEIQVRCYWVRKTSTSRPSKAKDSVNAVDRSGIPEKHLKGRALSLSTTVGNAEARQSVVTWVDIGYPRGRKPFAHFTFKYRTRDDLQIEGLIPRTPSPIPLEERDPDEMSPEEARELIRQLRAQVNQQINVKREQRERSSTITACDDDDEEVTIIQTDKRRRLDPDSGAEVVDLTDD